MEAAHRNTDLAPPEREGTRVFANGGAGNGGVSEVVHVEKRILDMIQNLLGSLDVITQTETICAGNETMVMSVLIITYNLLLFRGAYIRTQLTTIYIRSVSGPRANVRTYTYTAAHAYQGTAGCRAESILNSAVCWHANNHVVSEHIFVHAYIITSCIYTRSATRSAHLHQVSARFGG